MPAEASDDTAAKQRQYDSTQLVDLLPLYYKRLFPHMHFYRWLSYGHSESTIFPHREISFTLHNNIYIRSLSYENQNEFERDICSKNPFKIDIGAVMAARPRRRLTTSLATQPVKRELIFDIDMTDYDDVRTCCEGAQVCQKCWKYMVVAARILDTTLREDFGFKNILWVFSGRRGIHCWVCDYEARVLDGPTRTAVAEYMQVGARTVYDNSSVIRVHLNERIHHSIKRALKIITSMFEEIVLEDQKLFDLSTGGLARLLSYISEEAARKDLEAYLRGKLAADANSFDVWNSFTRLVNSMRNNTSSIWSSRKLKQIVEEVQLAILYPRLDIQVTKGMNHLLKAPFCIHPETGKICLPFSVTSVAKFDPITVPTITQLLQEINAFDDKSKEIRIKDYKKTSMYKGVLVFEEFLRKLKITFKQKAIEVSDMAMEF